MMRWTAETYGVSVPYSTYKKDGRLLYSLKGAVGYEASFEVINTSGLDYSNLGYTVCPMTAPQIVLGSGSINIANNGSAIIDIAVNDYVMETDDDLVVIFDFYN